MTTPVCRFEQPATPGPGFRPTVSHRQHPSAFGYEEHEWIVEGVEPGGPFRTMVLVRRPSDPSRCSGTVIVEPLHFSGIAPVALYCSDAIMRAGHVWVLVVSQRSTLEGIVRPRNPERYASLHIDGPESGELPRPDLDDRSKVEDFWDGLYRWNRASSWILAEVARAAHERVGPFAEFPVRHTVLVGHSQTGSVVTRYIAEAHPVVRRPDGRPVFDGYFPSGFPDEAFGPLGVPVVQVMSDGDVADPTGSFTPVAGRRYRRDDADGPDDLFRLYELAGVPHMSTREWPFDDPALWRAQGTDLPDGTVMSSLPHNELFSVCLHHLVEWVAHGTLPPRADRIELAPSGRFAVDEHGNSRGGLRCAQLDVPRALHHPTAGHGAGDLSFTSVGTETPFDAATMRHLYGSIEGYRARLARRAAELVDQGWFLADELSSLELDVRRASEQFA